MRRFLSRRQTAALGAALFASATFGVSWQIAHRPRPALRVGDFTFSTQDVRLRNRLARIYNPQETRDLGVIQLTKAYQFAQILKDHGYPLTESEVRKEQNRIETTTQAPQVLHQIHALFAGDESAYRRIYVLPVLAEHSLYFEYFLHDPLLQKKSAETVANFIAEASPAPSQFETVAKKYGSKAVLQTLPPTNDTSDISEPGARRILELVRLARPGSVLPIPIDNGETWLAVRWIQTRKDAAKTVELQSVTFSKDDFGPWVERELAAIPVTDMTH